MFYLIYVSTAASLLSINELVLLLDKSRANNDRLDITGMLLYKGGNFMQILEGDKQSVLNLYDVIKADSRHKNVSLIKTGKLGARNFENWSMGFTDMDKAESFPRYEDYFRDNFNLQSLSEKAQAAYEFIVHFNKTNS